MPIHLPAPLAVFGTGPYWDTWPFTPGYGDFWSSVTRAIFVALILGAILLFLRLLYGPKGIWRDKEMDREAEEARRKELEELDRKLRDGEISESLHRVMKKRLES